MSSIKAAITGVGGYVPDYVLTNKELETMVDTNDEWITSRTGIKQRHILKGENQGTSVLGTKAVERLLAKTNTSPEEIDLIICATVTPDMVFPATANMIAHNVGAVNSFSYDIGAACSGFLYALATGSKFVESGTHKKVVIVGGDKMSSIVDYEDRTTCVIFGDGAGAVLLEPTEGAGGHHRFCLEIRRIWGRSPAHESRWQSQTFFTCHCRCQRTLCLSRRRSCFQNLPSPIWQMWPQKSWKGTI